MLDTVCLLYIIRCDTYYVINLNTYILFSTECLETGHFADGYCDDVANTEICNWDGGDCCGPNRVIDYCTECQCHQTTTPTTPTSAPTTTTAPTTTAPTAGPTAAQTTTAATITCNAGWTGDNYCDDINNNMECGYDGGDCCGCDVNTDYCTDCQCLDPNGSGGGTTCSQTTTTAPTTTTVPTTSGGGVTGPTL